MSTEICVKVQKAFQAYLTGDAVDLGDIPKRNVFRGLSRGRKPEQDEGFWNNIFAFGFRKYRPCIVCLCSEANALDPIGEGNDWRVTGQIDIESSANKSTEDEHLARAEKVFDLIMLEDLELETTLSGALTDFSARLFVPQQQSYEIDGDVWRSTFPFEMNVVGADFP